MRTPVHQPFLGSKCNFNSNLKVTLNFTEHLSAIKADYPVDRFHMTSQRPYLCYENNDSVAMFVYKKITWELNSFHMLKLSFIPSNLQSCWPCDWKQSILIFNHFKPFEDIHNQTVLNEECCSVVKLRTALKWPIRQRG